MKGKRVQVLTKEIPFCEQGHPPLLHLGCARVVEWENLALSSPLSSQCIWKPSDVDKVLS